jgi:CRISPR system Cascade subunit CasA
MSGFNLVDEAWIPVVRCNDTRCELGLREALVSAGSIRCIEDESPLIVGALYRLLLAILYRALEGPTDIDMARALFKEGIPAERVHAYLEKWRDRFSLFDDKYPFFQIPTFEPKTWRAWTALAAEHNADNAKVLFDHVGIDTAGSISPAAAARWLLATQCFCLANANSELGYTSNAPSATAAHALPIGRSLQDTLFLSLTPQNKAVLAEDLPVWERTPESVETLKAGCERHAFGLADRYTWRTRSVRLQAGDSGQVEKLGFASGVECLSKDQVDPMVGYRIDEKRGKLPVQFRERGFWRDFDSLLPDGSKLGPQVIQHATLLGRSDRSRFPRTVLVLGQSNNKAKIEFWRMERFQLPEALADDQSIRAKIRELLSDAEETQKSLWSACRSYARDVLSRGGREPTGEDLRNFVDQMTPIPRYWSTLEARFHEVLGAYTIDHDHEAIRRVWLGSVQTALREAWEYHRASVSLGDAWSIRAVVRAELPIRRRLRELESDVQGDQDGRRRV